MQESRFDLTAVSRRGARRGASAAWRGLSDPFDPLEAIAKSAKLLRDLRREFGNLCVSFQPIWVLVYHICAVTFPARALSTKEFATLYCVTAMPRSSSARNAFRNVSSSIGLPVRSETTSLQIL